MTLLPSGVIRRLPGSYPLTTPSGLMRATL